MKGNLVKKICLLVTFILITLLLTTTIYALEAIATTKYIVKNNVIMRINNGTTVEEFLENVQVNSGASKAVYKGNTKVSGKTLLNTGMLLKIGNDTTYNLTLNCSIII